MSLLAPTEGWVLSVLGWAWLVVQELLPLPRALLQELVLYGGLGLCTVTLGAAASLPPDGRGGVYRAHLGATLAVWLLLAYGLADSLPEPATGP